MSNQVQLTLAVFCCALALAIALPSPRDILTGGQTVLTGKALKDAENELKSSLTKISALGAPHLEIVKVNTATSQVVAGYILRFSAELKDAQGTRRDCDISIWTRSWCVNGVEFNAYCHGLERIAKSYSPVYQGIELQNC